MNEQHDQLMTPNQIAIIRIILLASLIGFILYNTNQL
jgi:hypothetical protein